MSWNFILHCSLSRKLLATFDCTSSTSDWSLLIDSAAHIFHVLRTGQKEGSCSLQCAGRWGTYTVYSLQLCYIYSWIRIPISQVALDFFLTEHPYISNEKSLSSLIYHCNYLMPTQILLESPDSSNQLSFSLEVWEVRISLIILINNRCFGKIYEPMLGPFFSGKCEDQTCMREWEN